MSWIQENKFVAGLAGVTAVVGGAILFFGISQGGSYNEKLEKYEELKGQYTKLENAKPYPSAENRSAREDGIADYGKTIKEVRQIVAGYRPEKLEKMTPEQFKDLQVKMETELCILFKNCNTVMPEGCLFGFEKYNTGSVRAGATAKLNYQLGAVKWLYQKLAEAKPDKITNIRRAELAEESAKREEVAPRPGGRRGGRGNQPNQNGPTQGHQAAGRAYELMPMELAFTASESSVRQFLKEMVNSDQYYFSIRGVRIRNEKQLAPNQKDADFPKDAAPATDDGFGALEEFAEDSGEGDAAEGTGEADALVDAGDGSSDPVPSTIPAGELVLKQVLGSEKLHVYICFDIVLIEKKKENPSPSPRRKRRNNKGN